MLFLLSPAKTLDYETPAPAAAQPTDPLFVDRATELIKVLRGHDAGAISRLMDLSPALAELNVARYAAWRPRATESNSKPALFAFNGDVYEGLQAHTLKPADIAWAQQHVIILSGLYGVLRPLDRLQPYRLEMGTALATARGRNLYAYWGDTIAQHLNARLAEEARPVVVNLASEEYFKAAQSKSLNARVVQCVFEDWKGGAYKVISFHAKRARGLMARHAIAHRARTPKALQSFSAEGYAYAAEHSDTDRLVFRRRAS